MCVTYFVIFPVLLLMSENTQGHGTTVCRRGMTLANQEAAWSHTVTSILDTITSILDTITSILAGST